MRKKKKVRNSLLEYKLLPLYYHDSIEVSLSILESLYKGGIRVVEYTNRGEHALRNFKVLRKSVDKTMKEMQLGIGTIKTKRQAKQFIDEGADFVVSPLMSEKVAKVANDAGLLWIPGCMSTTEIGCAEECGAEIVKLFPGTLLGPSYVLSIRELFPDLKFMPTGGVEAESSNLEEWFKSGVAAVGMGSKLIRKEFIQNNDYEGLKAAVMHAQELVRRASLQ